MTTAGFRTLSELLADAGRRLCNGRIAVVTEGGYHLTALREGLECMIDRLAES
jgi:acetoin utilization deacetylase AcuC-like enzyme